MKQYPHIDMTFYNKTLYADHFYDCILSVFSIFMNEFCLFSIFMNYFCLFSIFMN